MLFDRRSTLPFGDQPRVCLVWVIAMYICQDLKLSDLEYPTPYRASNAVARVRRAVDDLVSAGDKVTRGDVIL